MTETTIPVTVENGHRKPGDRDGLLAWVKFNVDYLKTIPGILKLVQVILGVVAMAFASPARITGTHWFLFIVVISFIATVIWIFIYILSIREALTFPINWLVTELLNTAILAVLYLVASVLQLSVWSPPYHPQYRDPNITAGIFGLFNTVAYCAGAYFLFAEWKGTRVSAQ